MILPNLIPEFDGNGNSKSTSNDRDTMHRDVFKKPSKTPERTEDLYFRFYYFGSRQTLLGTPMHLTPRSTLNGNSPIFFNEQPSILLFLFENNDIMIIFVVSELLHLFLCRYWIAFQSFLIIFKSIPSFLFPVMIWYSPLNQAPQEFSHTSASFSTSKLKLIFFP